MYAHGNEPCHHFAYLYNYAGQPWKTQALVRQIADTLYNNTSAGICGNDDCGQTSAWFVFTALGFYPVDPADGVYVIGSPLADRATLTLDPGHYKGGKFTVVAKGNSPRNMYIQSATLNGRPYTRSWITHNQIVAGGTLELQMGRTPTRAGAPPVRIGPAPLASRNGWRDVTAIQEAEDRCLACAGFRGPNWCRSLLRRWHLVGPVIHGEVFRIHVSTLDIS